MQIMGVRGIPVRVIVVVLFLSVAGCAAPAPAPPMQAPIPHRATLEELVPALVARVRADRTTQSQDRLRITLGTTVVKDATGTSSVSIGSLGPSVASTSTTTMPGVAPTESRIIVLPQAVFVGPPPEPHEPGKEWIELDPTFSNQFSSAYAASVRLQRTIGTRIFCFTELGAASVTGSTDGQLDGLPVVDYAVHVDLGRPADDEASAANLRSLGLTAFDATTTVDADDRVRRCRLDQALPRGAGSVVIDQRFFGFGEPVTIVAPGPDSVLMATS